MRDACILGIETSCDETAAAVVRSGERVLSNVVSSQIATHRPYGGVVPELASREHLRAIVPVVRQALAEAGETFQSVDALAVTRGPGLAGALLVGISYAKALAYALAKPLITVNHLEGHIHAVLLEEKQKGDFQVEFPALALVVSGGHTHLFLAERVSAEKALDCANEARGRSSEALRSPRKERVSAERVLDRANEARGRSNEALRSPRRDEAGRGWKYQNIGRTRDDAAGEAYDKVAKLLGLGYPGGPIIDALAKHGNPRAVKFGLSQIKHPNRGTPSAEQTAFDFSFSGIKTAVLRYVQTENMSSAIEARRVAVAKLPKPNAAGILPLCDKKTLDLIASFQRAVVDDLVAKTLSAGRECAARTLFVTGGVAANSELREKFEKEASREGLPVYFPSRQLSTDNAAMIAAAAYPKFLAHDFAPAEFSAEASLAL